jgi:NADH-quinone oxidoreductase subunit E
MERASSEPLETVDPKVIDQIISREHGRPGALLGILETIRNEHPNKYLPMETLEYIAERADIPLSRIYSVVTFYAMFNLTPQGRNSILICRGTACHTRGSRDLLEKLQMTLGVQAAKEGDMLSMTTADGKTTLRMVACFGQCALAPVVEINHEILGHVNERTMLRELEALDDQEPKK